MFEENNGLGYLYTAYDEYVRKEEAEGRKPAGFLKFAFGRI